MSQANKPIQVLGIAGSLRQASYNRAALRVATELAPDEMQIETFDLAPIPIYNDDVRLQAYPPPVAEFRERIAAADALLIVTPEYNFSIPGVLKNAIDWASRPPDQPFNGKPVAIMGCTPGLWGTARSQMHLRQVCVFLNLLPLNAPQVLISQAHQKFDEQGRLTDEQTGRFIRELLDALLKWTRRLDG